MSKQADEAGLLTGNIEEKEEAVVYFSMRRIVAAKMEDAVLP